MLTASQRALCENQTMKDAETRRYVEWIREALKQPGKTQIGLARHLNLAHPQITQLLKGKRGLKVGEVPRIAAYLGVEPPVENEPVVLRVPLLSTVSAGAMSRDEVQDEKIGDVVMSDLPPGDWIALKVDGDSMDRISPPESIILVDRNDKRLSPNACYIVANKDGEATYKRWRPGPPPRFEPVSTNPSHEPIFPDNDVPVIGRVKLSMIKM